MLHTDLLNKEKREDFITDLNKINQNTTIISKEVKELYNKVLDSINKDDLTEINDREMSLFLGENILAGLNYELDAESNKTLNELKEIARKAGIDYSSLSSEQLVEEVLYIRSNYSSDETGKITSNYSVSDKSKLILLYD